MNALCFSSGGQRIHSKRDNFDREAQNCERVRLPRVDMRVLGYTKGGKVRFI